MEISHLNTDKLLYNPLDKTSYSQLTKHKEFSADIGNLSWEKIVKWIIILYDPKSDLHKEIPHYPTRKAEAMKMVGYSAAKGKFEKLVEDVLVGENEKVNAMIARYISLFGSSDYMSLCSYYEIFRRLTKSALAGKDTEANTIRNLDAVSEKISELENKVVGGDEITNFKKELYKALERTINEIKPEKIAQKLSEGKKPINEGAYGNYEPEPLRFAGDR